MGTITHHHQTAIADNPSKDVSRVAWNEGHDFSLDKSDVGLSNVDNTTDASKLAAAAAAAAVLYRPKLSANTTINVPSQHATLEAALTFASQIDFNGFTLTIQLANGTYTPSNFFTIPATVGQKVASNLVLRGDPTTPSNVVLNSTLSFSGTVEVGAGVKVRIQGVKFTGGGNTFGIHAIAGGYVEYLDVEFGTGLFSAMSSESAGSTVCVGNINVSASMTAVVFATNGGFAFQIGSVVTITGTPAWIAGYAWADAGAFIRIAGGTSFPGAAATGPRFSSQRNSVIDVSGAGANYLPGNAAGSTATNGLYS